MLERTSKRTFTQCCVLKQRKKPCLQRFCLLMRKVYFFSLLVVVIHTNIIYQSVISFSYIFLFFLFSCLHRPFFLDITSLCKIMNVCVCLYVYVCLRVCVLFLLHIYVRRLIAYIITIVAVPFLFSFTI
jgi:hypothetical protein